MKSFFYRNINKITAMAVIVVVASFLTSCRQGAWPTTVYTTWGAEFSQLKGMQVVFGWPVALISYPIAWLCSTIGKALGNSYAVGILFTTLIVRTIAWPIYSKQNGATIKMTVMQPEMQRIQAKYATRKDPESQQRQSQEMAALYKKYKFNPLGCMFTTVMQFPIFMAMYEVVRRINLNIVTKNEAGEIISSIPGKFALSNTKIFNYFELNTSFFDATLAQDKIFAVVLALAFGAVTYVSQKISSKKPSYQKTYPNQNPAADSQAKQMKMMTTVMNVMFVFMSLQSTSLALYWLIGGIYQLGQSQVGRYMNEKNYYKMKEKNM